MTLRESFLWGLVGGLSFLVLVQAYELLADVRVSFAVKFGVALVVASAATVSARILARRLIENGRS